MSEPMIFQGSNVALKFGPAGNPGISQQFSVVPLLPNYVQGPTDSIAWDVDDPTALELVVDTSDPKVAYGNARDVSETKHVVVSCTVDADLDDGEVRPLVAQWNVSIEPYEVTGLHVSP